MKPNAGPRGWGGLEENQKKKPPHTIFIPPHLIASTQTRFNNHPTFDINFYSIKTLLYVRNVRKYVLFILRSLL